MRVRHLPAPDPHSLYYLTQRATEAHAARRDLVSTTTEAGRLTPCSEAIGAVDRLVAARLEGDLGLLAALLQAAGNIWRGGRSSPPPAL